MKYDENILFMARVNVMHSDILKVAKFCGSSLATSKNFVAVKNIILSQPERMYIVVSAPGARFKGDVKVTDLLYKCYDLSLENKDFSEPFEEIKRRYGEITDNLNIDIDIDFEFRRLYNHIKNREGQDLVASRGEYICAKIMAKYLGFDFVDAEGLILFFENGKLDPDRTNDALQDELGKHKYAVIPGFYGSIAYGERKGEIKTFSRGGSDITGAIVARAVMADLYENWTDVSGFLMADPRIIDSPTPIEIVTYKELRELSYMGASVLHAESIYPVRYAGIPILIKNTMSPEDSGTLIVPKGEKEMPKKITGIAGKKGFTAVTVFKDMMNSEIGFYRRLLECFEKLNIPVEHSPSGIDTITVIIPSESIRECRRELLCLICDAVNPEWTVIEEGLSLIAVVGSALKGSESVLDRIFKAVAGAKIEIKIIDMGIGEGTIILATSEINYELAISSLYKELAG